MPLSAVLRDIVSLISAGVDVAATITDLVLLSDDVMLASNVAMLVSAEVVVVA